MWLRGGGLTPPDGGFGWIFVFAVAVTDTVSIGFERNNTLFYQQLLDRYRQSAMATTWCISLGHGVRLIGSPLAGWLCNKFGHRSMAFVSALLMFFGFIGTAYIPSLYTTFITHSIMRCFGVGMFMLCKVSLTNMYFVKKKARANALISMSGAFGGMYMAPLLSLLFYEYGYSGALLIVAGMHLHNTISALLFRPVIVSPEKGPVEENEHQTEQLLTTVADKGPVEEIEHQTGQLLTTVTEQSSIPEEIGHQTEQLLTTVAENGSIPEGTEHPPQQLGDFRKESGIPDSLTSRETSSEISNENSKIDLEDASTIDKTSNQLSIGITNPKYSDALKGQQQDTQMCLMGNSSSKEYSEGAKYPTDQPKRGKPSSGCFDKFVKSTGIGLLRNIRLAFFMIFLSGTFYNFSTVAVIAPLCVEKGFTMYEVTIMLTICPGVETVTRIALGALFDMKFVRRRRDVLLAFLGFITGVCSLVIPLIPVMPLVMTVWTLKQVCFGALLSQWPTIMSDILPKHQITSGVGVSRLFQGLGSILSPFIAGCFKDFTGSYAPGYYMSGLIAIAASLLQIVMAIKLKK